MFLHVATKEISAAFARTLGNPFRFRYWTHARFSEGPQLKPPHIFRGRTKRGISFSIAVAKVALLAILNPSEAGDLEAGQAAAKSDPLAAALASAAAHRVAVVDARAMVDDKGRRTRLKRQAPWQLLVPSATLPPWRRPKLAASEQRLVIIHVHGYNTPPAEAINSGIFLWEMIKIANEKLSVGMEVPLPTEFLEFMTFLWRGDLEFSRAKKAADISSASLLDFTLAISSTLSNAKLIVIAHSLGARVALETLKSVCKPREGRRLWDSLILVQGAVPAVSLHKWAVTDALNTSYNEENSGRYADIIQCTRQLIVTCSEKDGVLGRWFQLDETWRGGPPPHGTIPRMPFGQSSDPKVGVTAIGSCFDRVDKTEILPMPDFSIIDRLDRDFDDWRKYDPFRISPPWIDKAVSILSFKNWRIDHPSLVELRISSGLQDDGLDWHSPLKDLRGLQIVSDIWTHVMKGIQLEGAP